MEKRFERVALSTADILLPAGVEMEKWAVVACDQFTSQPGYWAEAEKFVGDAPSTLRMILPEAQLRSARVDERIRDIGRAMADYMARDLFRVCPDSMVYLERTQSDGAVRRGLVAAIDLEQYDYMPGAKVLIRATEGTVLERIPPRVRVRQDAPLELPHVMALIDDPGRTCIEPLQRETGRMEPLYAFPLMLGGGYLKGWRLTPEQVGRVVEALEGLIAPETVEEKYGLSGAEPLLFAVGDGNHSLATAKTCYENLKKQTPREKWRDLPARYALVEVVNLHDDAIWFEAIHRVAFGVDAETLMRAFKRAYPNAYEGRGRGHTIEMVWPGHDGYITVPDPTFQLPVGTLQHFLDDYLAEHGGEVDYIHGTAVARELGNKEGNMGFLLPAMGKDQLFKTVMADGVLPRKTFSMGHARDKRYYVEGRRIR